MGSPCVLRGGVPVDWNYAMADLTKAAYPEPTAQYCNMQPSAPLMHLSDRANASRRWPAQHQQMQLFQATQPGDFGAACSRPAASQHARRQVI
jgi:hypothetical protein